MAREYVFDHWAVLAFQHDDLRSSKQWDGRITCEVSPR
jgi:hypothetical protein